MKKILRFAALSAAIGLTSWLALGDRAARAEPPCDFLQGKVCFSGGPGWEYCAPGGVCFCTDGHWDCGWGGDTGFVRR
jgi:hypothetical protein